VRQRPLEPRPPAAPVRSHFAHAKGGRVSTSLSWPSSSGWLLCFRRPLDKAAAGSVRRHDTPPRPAPCLATVLFMSAATPRRTSQRRRRRRSTAFTGCYLPRTRRTGACTTSIEIHAATVAPTAPSATASHDALIEAGPDRHPARLKSKSTASLRARAENVPSTVPKAPRAGRARYG